jgi:hypothetical protein
MQRVGEGAHLTGGATGEPGGTAAPRTSAPSIPSAWRDCPQPWPRPRPLPSPSPPGASGRRRALPRRTRDPARGSGSATPAPAAFRRASAAAAPRGGRRPAAAKSPARAAGRAPSLLSCGPGAMRETSGALRATKGHRGSRSLSSPMFPVATGWQGHGAHPPAPRLWSLTPSGASNVGQVIGRRAWCPLSLLHRHLPGYPFSSCFSSVRKRQSVPWARSFWGPLLMMLASCRRRA